MPVEQRQNGEYDHQVTYPVPQQGSTPIGQRFDAGDLLHVFGSALTFFDGEQHVNGAHERLGYGAVERHLVAQITSTGQFQELKRT